MSSIYDIYPMLHCYIGKNVVFGYIADKVSQELVDDLAVEGSSLTGEPKVKAVISKCGILEKK